MAGNNRTVQLQSNEGDIFDVDIALIEQSEVLKGFSETNDEDPIPLPNINSTVLKKVIEYMDYHKNDIPQSDEGDNDTRENGLGHISDWDQDFLNISNELLFDLVLAANYLNMKNLLDITCRKIANMIKGKSPKDIMRTFNVKDDFTSEEQKQIQKEEEWMSES